MNGGSSFLTGSDRDRLIEAVAGLCAEGGYEALDEGLIAGRAGLPVTAFRENFPGGKEECLAEAENAILLEVVAAVSRSYSADQSEWESVMNGIKAILELMAENPAFAYLGYVAARQMAPGRVRDMYETGHRMLEAMLERGEEYSGNRQQPPTTALGILGGAEAIVRRELVAGRAQQLPRILPECIYAAFVPYLGQEEALRLAREGERLLR